MLIALLAVASTSLAQSQAYADMLLGSADILVVDCGSSPTLEGIDFLACGYSDDDFDLFEVKTEIAFLTEDFSQYGGWKYYADGGVYMANFYNTTDLVTVAYSGKDEPIMLWYDADFF